MESQKVDGLVCWLEVFRKLHHLDHLGQFRHACLHRLWQQTVWRKLRVHQKSKHGSGWHGFLNHFPSRMYLENTLKGILLHKNSYMRDIWSWLDFFVVIISVVGWLPGDNNNSSLKSLRTFRILRPLRSINSMPQMKALITILGATLKGLLNVFIFLAFVFSIFAIFASSALPPGLKKSASGHRQRGDAPVPRSTVWLSYEHLFEICVTLRFPLKLPNADP